ncbi:glycine cleavage T protein (aminomethyl transferase) [Actinobacteria bacterium OK074]|nr:glycine cleavage T protein (aminomethyl transferase) [Actinobacteria bacterium OK074]
MTAAPSLQDGIDRAGSPVELLWKPGAAPWTPEVVEREYAGWRQEQTAWHDGVAILDLSHHMFDTVVEGPDATRLLTAVSANNYEKFAVGQAKQFIPVTEEGLIVTDGILLRESEQRYTLSGIPASQNWVKYHGEKGGYDVAFATDPSSAFRRGGDPKLFRYQIQGPGATALVEQVFGGPLPPTKFFHAATVTLAGRTFRALRHGMSGQAGFEFIGDWQHAQAVKDAFLTTGEQFGLIHVGALAYASASVESGWIPSPIPAVYSAPELAEYRQWVPLYGIEGQRPLNGSYFSENIEDYYCSPYELGYGRSISFNHDFIGREALQKAKDDVRRTKVTLVLDPEDVRRVRGPEADDYHLTYARHRVETPAGALVGMTMQSATLDPSGTILSLALIDRAHAKPGTQVTVTWGEHPGAGTAPDADLGFPKIRATVQPAPFDDHARTTYRRNA